MSKTTSRSRVPLTRIVRRVHMYLALFLAPWILMYAISTLVMNHRALFVRWYGDTPVSWTEEFRREYEPQFEPGAELSSIAKTILTDLELDGHHGVRRNSQTGEITITRQDPFQVRRIRFNPAEEQLVVEREKTRIHSLLNRLHSRRGYGHDYAADSRWAFSVDLFISSMVVWALSGLWLWWTLRKTRVLGAFCLVCGLCLFGLFLLSI